MAWSLGELISEDPSTVSASPFPRGPLNVFDSHARLFRSLYCDLN